MLGMNQDVAINKLLEKGVIARTGRRGYYFICDSGDVAYTRLEVVNRFLEDMVENGRYFLKLIEVQRALNWNRPVLRTITREGYHCADRDYSSAIERVAYDADGVRRTFGLEYEIYSLTEEQEDKLARLLDTLPSEVEFVAERDGSLGSRGIELVFMPLSAEAYIATVKTLNQFIRDNRVCMEQGSSMAGMHTTYGVSNPQASKMDLQIRLNRFALAVKAVATKTKILEMFGRDFGSYRTLPTQTTDMNHQNAFSCNGRPSSCWECRLPSWRANPEKLVEFLKATEVAFYRPIEAQDFIKVFEMFGVAYEG